MNFEQFKAQVIDEMRDRFPELDISLQEVSKLQGESYIGMAVRPKDSNIAATTNLKAFFEDLGEDFNMDDVMDQIAHDISDQISHMPQFDEHVLNDYEQMKGKLTEAQSGLNANMFQLRAFLGLSEQEMRKSSPRSPTAMWRIWPSCIALR